MRRSARRYEPIMTAYEGMLEQRGEIKPQSKGVSINHANRLFEVCLRSLTPEALEAMAKVWFPGGGYTTVISELKQLVSQRERKARKVKS